MQTTAQVKLNNINHMSAVSKTKFLNAIYTKICKNLLSYSFLKLCTYVLNLCLNTISITNAY